MNRIHWPVQARKVDKRRSAWLLVPLGLALLLGALFMIGRLL